MLVKQVFAAIQSSRSAGSDTSYLFRNIDPNVRDLQQTITILRVRSTWPWRNSLGLPLHCISRSLYHIALFVFLHSSHHPAHEARRSRIESSSEAKDQPGLNEIRKKDERGLVGSEATTLRVIFEELKISLFCLVIHWFYKWHINDLASKIQQVKESSTSHSTLRLLLSL